MSENKNLQNEEELWDLLSEPTAAEPRAEKPKGPKFLKSEPGVEAAAKPEPAVKADPIPAAEPAPAKKSNRFDGFFLACMAGVAAVSVAATLIVSGMLGGSADVPVQGGSAMSDNSVSAELEQQNADLKLENAELKAQLEQQKEQVKELQNDLLTLMGSEDFIANAATDPNGESEEMTAQMQALDTYAAIQEAYADFDRAKLEELIPQMDEQLAYLSPEMLNNYYLILEYVEQPSNG